MKRAVILMFCALSTLALVSCHDADGRSDSSQATTGKKSGFIIEEVTN